jgi:hypothetical protein
MIPARQREALNVLADLCELSDDVRLGQLLALLGLLSEDETGRNLWDIEDEDFLAILYRHKAELQARLADASVSKDRSAAQVLIPSVPVKGDEARSSLPGAKH